MKRGNINNILIVILISFVLILLGSIFNIFTMTGNMSKCPKTPLNLLRCSEGYSLVPNYNRENCIYAYQCAAINCPDTVLPDCNYDQSPAPIFGWYQGNYCAFDYECINKPECSFVPRPPWVCKDDKELTPVFDANGCVKVYQCTEKISYS